MNRTDIRVTSLTMLQLVYVAELDQGTNAWVDSEGCYFVLDKSSGATTGPDVVAPISGSPIAGAGNARWIRTTAKTTLTAIQTQAYSANARELVRVNPTGGAFQVTLPSAVGLGPDDAVVVKNVSSSVNAVTVACVLGQTIDSVPTSTLSTAFGSRSFVPDGANWMAFPN